LKARTDDTRSSLPIMKSHITRATLLSLALAGGLTAQEAATAEPAATNTAATPKIAVVEAAAEPAAAEPVKGSEQKAEPKKTKAEKREEQMKKEQARLALENALADEKVKRQTAKLRAEVARLRAEKEAMAERLAHAAMQRQVKDQKEAVEMEIEKARLEREGALAKARAEALSNELKAVQAQAGIDVTRLKGEISELEMEAKRKEYADAKPQYLKKPLRDDGTLVISDRRIALNGPISGDTADYITDRIHYFNNQDREHPMFIVIDECPGGSVMAGYRILKAMEASDAPVHVVVKSFAASMAAAITTLAEESYCYPNAVILHHQISSTLMGRMNLTQQAEMVKESMRWWERLATPIADRMGITKEEMITRMYEHSSSGDWSEFGVEAQKLKWVKHIVTGIDESSFLRSPDADKGGDKSGTPQRTGLSETLDDEGRPVMYLPRINPKDVYFLYNPDGYYQVR